MWTARIGLLVVVTFGMATCGGREALRVGVEVRGTSTETPEAVAKAVLTNLPTAALRERLQRRVLDVPLDGITVTTSTRTERAHPEGGQTTVKVWLESKCRIEAGSPPSAKWQTRAARNWSRRVDLAVLLMSSERKQAWSSPSWTEPF